MRGIKRGFFLKLSLLVLFISFVAAGIVRDEVWDVISNATIICYSCIGLK